MKFKVVNDCTEKDDVEQVTEVSLKEWYGDVAIVARQGDRYAFIVGITKNGKIRRYQGVSHTQVVGFSLEDYGRVQEEL